MASSTGVTSHKSATGAAETPSANDSEPNRQVIIGFVIQAGTGEPPIEPAAPTGLVATAGNGTVSLDWDDNTEPNLDGYNVYRSTTSGSGYSQINGSLLSSSDYTDNSVTNGTTYYYVVTAVDTESNESGYSSEESATPNDGSIIQLSYADFESGFGEWVNVTGDSHDWTRDSGGTPYNAPYTST